MHSCKSLAACVNEMKGLLSEVNHCEEWENRTQQKEEHWECVFLIVLIFP